MAEHRPTDSLEEQLRTQKRLAASHRRRRRRRWLIPLLLIAAVALAGLFWLLHDRVPAEEPPAPTEPGDSVVTLAFVGDISMDEAMLYSLRTAGGWDFSDCFAWVTPQISAADLAIGNLEGNIVDAGAAGDHKYPASFLTALYNCGFDVLQTANSYTIDNGIAGLTRTKQEIEAAGMDALGSFESQAARDESGGVLVKEVGGLRIAFIGMTKGMNSLRLPDGAEYCVNLLYSDYDSNYSNIARGAITALVGNAKAQDPDLIVAMVHWGSEYTREPTSSQKQIAALLQEQGVDLIVGSHSHYVGPMLRSGSSARVLAGGGFVAYSLGDFLSCADTDDAHNGCILTVELLEHEGQTRIRTISYEPTYSAYPDETLQTTRYEILPSQYAIDLCKGSYYDRISQPLYERLVQAVAQMKGVILDYIEQGGTFDQFVMEMRALTVQERALKAQAYKKVGQLIKEGKLDEARAYRDSFNAVMDEQGFPPLKYPPNVNKMLGD